jgi:hypothetical protein
MDPDGVSNGTGFKGHPLNCYIQGESARELFVRMAINSQQALKRAMSDGLY